MMEHIGGFVVGAEWIWLILIAVVIIVPITVIVTRRGKKEDFKEFGLASDESLDDEKIKNSHDETALNILKERLAKGELTKEEYEDLKSALE